MKSRTKKTKKVSRVKSAKHIHHSHGPFFCTTSIRIIGVGLTACLLIVGYLFTTKPITSSSMVLGDATTVSHDSPSAHDSHPTGDNSGSSSDNHNCTPNLLNAFCLFDHPQQQPNGDQTNPPSEPTDSAEPTSTPHDQPNPTPHCFVKRVCPEGVACNDSGCPSTCTTVTVCPPTEPEVTHSEPHITNGEIHPTCTPGPRPQCLNQHPPCEIAEPAGGWCDNGDSNSPGEATTTITPTQENSAHQSANEPTITPEVTCIEEPSCVTAQGSAHCDYPTPQQGWCPPSNNPPSEQQSQSLLDYVNSWLRSLFSGSH